MVERAERELDLDDLKELVNVISADQQNSELQSLRLTLNENIHDISNIIKDENYENDRYESNTEKDHNVFDEGKRLLSTLTTQKKHQTSNILGNIDIFIIVLTGQEELNSDDIRILKSLREILHNFRSLQSDENTLDTLKRYIDYIELRLNSSTIHDTKTYEDCINTCLVKWNRHHFNLICVLCEEFPHITLKNLRLLLKIAVKAQEMNLQTALNSFCLKIVNTLTTESRFQEAVLWSIFPNIRPDGIGTVKILILVYCALIQNMNTLSVESRRSLDMWEKTEEFENLRIIRERIKDDQDGSMNWVNRVLEQMELADPPDIATGITIIKSIIFGSDQSNHTLEIKKEQLIEFLTQIQTAIDEYS